MRLGIFRLVTLFVFVSTASIIVKQEAFAQSQQFKLKLLVQPWLHAMVPQSSQEYYCKQGQCRRLNLKKKQCLKGSLGAGLIFSLGVSSNDRVQARNNLPAYKAIKSKMQYKAAKIARLQLVKAFIASANYQERMKRYYTSYNDLFEEVQAYQLSEQYLEADQINHRLISALKNTQIDWTLVAGARIDQMSEILKAGAYSHVLIVGHANAKGQIFDAYRNPIPDSFFIGLPKKIKSISLFCCNSTKAINRYFSSPTAVFDASGQLVFIPVSKWFRKPHEGVYLHRARNFLRSVDRKLSFRSVYRS